MAPFDADVDPVKQAKALVKELEKYDPELAAKPRWVVLNKLDMVPEGERAARAKDIVKRLKFKGPVFEVSALAREGLQPLLHAIYEHVHAQVEQPAPPVDPRFGEAAQAAGPVVIEAFPEVEPPAAPVVAERVARSAKAIRTAKGGKKADNDEPVDPRFAPQDPEPEASAEAAAPVRRRKSAA